MSISDGSLSSPTMPMTTTTPTPIPTTRFFDATVKTTSAFNSTGLQHLPQRNFLAASNSYNHFNGSHHQSWTAPPQTNINLPLPIFGRSMQFPRIGHPTAATIRPLLPPPPHLPPAVIRLPAPRPAAALPADKCITVIDLTSEDKPKSSPISPGSPSVSNPAWLSAGNEPNRKSNENWLMRSQLCRILDAFSLLSGKISSQNSQIVQNHLGRPPDKDSFIGHLGQLAALMTEFASSQLVFSSLDRDDQNILLKSNVPLYLQYIVARYFSAATGVDQLSWILEGQFCIESIEVVQTLHKISLAEFDLAVQMFASTEAAKVFTHHVEKIGANYPFPQHCNGLIANMLLYVTDDIDVSCLKEPRRIQCIFESARELVRTGLKSLDRKLDADVISNIGPLIHSLKEMKLIFGTCRFSTHRNISSYAIDVAYTDTEELWLRRQFRKFKAEYIVPVPPKEYYEQLIELLQTGKPTGETFVVSWMGMMTERVWRVLKMHPEFDSLSQAEQAALWNNNHKAAVGLGSAQANSMKTGKEQLRVILGHLEQENDSWEYQYKGIDLNRLTGSYLHEPEINHGRLDESDIQCFINIMKEISQIVSNDQLFQLSVLLTILDTDGLDYTGQFTDIVRIRQIYLKLFQRKLKASGCSYIDYASFRRTLTKVRTFATLLENFGSP